MSEPNLLIQIETTAWITDDEAEFFTSVTPVSSATTSLCVESKSFHVLHFKFDHLSEPRKDYDPSNQDKVQNETTQCPLNTFASLDETHYDEEQYTEPNKAEDSYATNQRADQKHDDISPNSSAASTASDDLFNRLFMFLNEMPIIGVLYYNEQNTSDNRNDNNGGINSFLFNDINAMRRFQSFIDELFEEVDVLRGTIDEDTLFNRRSKSLQRSVDYL